MGLLVTLIGDMVGSRDLPDRAGVQRRLAAVLNEVTGLLDPAQRLETTVGDEFQGAFDDVGTATLAALMVRLALLPEVDVRCGLGEGEVVVHDPTSTPLLQDGPGWWAARAALEELARPRRSAARTWFKGPDPGAAARVNAFLLARDALVDRLGERGLRLLAASLRGSTQADIAAAEGISRSAVSQQFSRGVGAVRDAQALISPPRGDGEDDT
ncbi:hypothetical protein NOK12_37700 [Nocardioides sp. OK12]|uniref:SatD family protein n=1 Tax=Nocardioides sp. OK12 TaxID=2758661 RepID=UPI0021C3AE04|nr:SatD family protein [Nocardioides sp. OK12]GHJ61252.1 hypothetical protein NOK12_37700 [Nocardioides sp. OK12]